MKAKTAERKAERRRFTAAEKCRAVLALWTGRRRPSEVCRELGVPSNLLQAWQERALEGMLKALEPRTRRQEDRGPILADRLQKMLERKTALLGNRLARLSGKPAKAPAPEKPTGKE